MEKLKRKEKREETHKTNWFVNKSQKFEKLCNWFQWINWFWQGACQSAGEREWPAPGHDQDHRERHHRMLYSVTEKGWREEKRGRCLLVTCLNLRNLQKN